MGKYTPSFISSKFKGVSFKDVVARGKGSLKSSQVTHKFIKPLELNTCQTSFSGRVKWLEVSLNDEKVSLFSNCLVGEMKAQLLYFFWVRWGCLLLWGKYVLMSSNIDDVLIEFRSKDELLQSSFFTSLAHWSISFGFFRKDVELSCRGLLLRIWDENFS